MIEETVFPLVFNKDVVLMNTMFLGPTITMLWGPLIR